MVLMQLWFWNRILVILQGNNNSFPRFTSFATLNLVAGDYIEIYLRMQEGDLNAFANDQMSFFQGYKIIGA
jgi:hypothetical protein